jgi:hypothetical protein
MTKSFDPRRDCLPPLPKTMAQHTCPYCAWWKRAEDVCCTRCKNDTAEAVYNRMMTLRIQEAALRPRAPWIGPIPPQRPAAYDMYGEKTATAINARRAEAIDRMVSVVAAVQAANAEVERKFGQRVLAWCYADCEPCHDFLSEYEA